MWRGCGDCAAGVPDLPSANQLVELEFASIGDKKLRGQLRSADQIEMQITAMFIAALKRLNKNTTILLLDRNGSSSKVLRRGRAAPGGIVGRYGALWGRRPGPRRSLPGTRGRAGSDRLVCKSICESMKTPATPGRASRAS